MAELPTVYEETLGELERAFESLVSRRELPRAIPRRDGHVFRCAPSLENAIVLKLSRVLSGLHAVLVLFRAGLFQEVGVILRLLDELHEVVWFLCIPLAAGEKPTELHARYLKDFYQEEFDNPDSAFNSTQKRDTVPHKKLQAALARYFKLALNPHDAQELTRTLRQVFSGYVHAAAGHILEMFDGQRFWVSDMSGTPREMEFAKQVPHYFSRGLCDLMQATHCLGADDLFSRLDDVRQRFDRQVPLRRNFDIAQHIQDLRRGKS